MTSKESCDNAIADVLNRIQKQGCSVSVINPDNKKPSATEPQASKTKDLVNKFESSLLESKNELLNAALTQANLDNKHAGPQTRSGNAISTTEKFNALLSKSVQRNTVKSGGNSGRNNQSLMFDVMQTNQVRMGLNSSTPQENKPATNQNRTGPGIQNNPTRMSMSTPNKPNTQARLNQNVASVALENKGGNVQNRNPQIPIPSMNKNVNQAKFARNVSLLQGNKSIVQNIQPMNSVQQPRQLQGIQKVQESVRAPMNMPEVKGNSNQTRMIQQNVPVPMEGTKPVRQLRNVPAIAAESQAGQTRSVHSVTTSTESRMICHQSKTQQFVKETASKITSKCENSQSSVSTVTTSMSSRNIAAKRNPIQFTPIAKKKCPQPVQDNIKSLKSSQMSQANEDETSKEMFNRGNLSSKIPFKTLSSLGTTIQEVSNSPSTNNQTRNRQPQQEVRASVEKTLCPTCGNPSQNQITCDTCKHSMVPPSPGMYKEVKMTRERKVNLQPIMVRQTTKQVVQRQVLHIQHAVQTREMVIVDNQNRGLAQLRNRTRIKRKKEPELLTLSSDDEEPMADIFASSMQEISPIIPAGSHDVEKSEHSSSSDILQDMHDSEDPIYPGVNRIGSMPRENIEYSEEEFEDEEMDEDMEGMEEEEEMVDEDEEEEEPEEEDEEDEELEEPGNNKIASGVMHPPVYPIVCRSIRVGSFKVHPSGSQSFIPIYVKEDCFAFQVPTVNDPKKLLNVNLKGSDIISTLANFGKCLPIIFISATTSFGENLRKALNMSKSDIMYYDPTSNDDKQKRITFIIETFTEEHKSFMRYVFPGKKLKEVDQKSANEILVKSTPNQGLVRCEVAPFKECPPFKAINEVVSPQEEPKQALPEVKKLVTYPPPPQTGGVAITTEDIKCLDEGEFLNDAIIDFYLKYMFSEKLNDYHREKTYIFSSFFYPRLTQKPVKQKNSEETMQMRRHSQVKTWTRHVDIFSKDYIIIPINQNMHWFLAIICFPGHVPEAPIKAEPKAKAKETPDGDPTKTPTKQPKDDDDDSEDESAMYELEEPPDSEELTSDLDNGDATYTDKNRPCICIFDSLSGPSRWRIAAALREYLEVEWWTKKGTNRLFNRKTMQGYSMLCPQQSNFHDCGIYVLQYVESFFENPIPYFNSPMPDLTKWFTEEKITNKRQQIKELITMLQRRQATKVAIKNANLSNSKCSLPKTPHQDTR